ncbi:hypothetical protein FCULG_00012658 [Fusarium culmorum]|uniref:Uncharacterized protein n=1 Tax=Fusarium culmorum TaxID=5516 RepID=A0A2T4GCF7_FUSCU|nr:hypothetical protein FCULG_00012658 [Fusarium culmorum]
MHGDTLELQNGDSIKRTTQRTIKLTSHEGFISFYDVAYCSLRCCLQTATPKSKAAYKLSALSGMDLSVGFDYKGDCILSIGTLNSFMIFIDFSDAKPI